MKITISKILNKTDLAKTDSHGGLIVTKSSQDALKDFFDGVREEREFVDKRDNEIFNIHYQDYTSNHTTPNDRVTPIGKYASKYQLTPGDILVFEKTLTEDVRKYYIEHIKRHASIFFIGKSKRTVDALNFEQLSDVFADHVSAGIIKRTSSSSFEMKCRYLGEEGILRIFENDKNYELHFDGIAVSENNKYFELDTSIMPFELKKVETWRVMVNLDKADIIANEQAEAELIVQLSESAFTEEVTSYVPTREPKAPEKEYKGRKMPARNSTRARNALKRADFKCEVDDHDTFLRKTNRKPYTEPHHLIPMEYDCLFEYSLDVEANIVSLCSTCHNKIHYGADAEPMLRQLWELRKLELEQAGLLVMKNGVEITADLFLSFYGIK